MRRSEVVAGQRWRLAACLITLAAVVVGLATPAAMARTTARRSTWLITSTPQVPASTPVRLEGRVPGGPRRVQIQELRTHSWRRLGAATSDRSGHFSWASPLPQGAHRLRAFAPATRVRGRRAARRGTNGVLVQVQAAASTPPSSLPPSASTTLGTPLPGPTLPGPTPPGPTTPSPTTPGSSDPTTPSPTPSYDGPPAIADANLPDAQIARSYAYQFSSADGRPGTWRAGAGVPEGFYLDPDTGSLDGSPTGPPGVYTFAVTFTDEKFQCVTTSESLRISQYAVAPEAPRPISSGHFTRFPPLTEAHGGGVPISADGRYVVVGDDPYFSEPAAQYDNLDLQLIDRATGSRTIIVAADQHSDEPSISGDGRFVAFTSYARNVVFGEHTYGPNVFLWDRETQETVSVTGSTYPEAHRTGAPSVSTDGRYVAFVSDSGLLDDTDQSKNSIYVWDRLTRHTEKVTDNSITASTPSISGDGRYVTFVGDQTPDDSSSAGDIFVWDTATATTERITDGGGDNLNPQLSADGQHVVFAQSHSILQRSATKGDVLVWDRSSDQVNHVDHGDGMSYAPSISGDGRFITFANADWEEQEIDGHTFTNYPPFDSARPSDIFVWDRSTLSTTATTSSNHRTWHASISADGDHVTFMSTATNLVPTDSSAASRYVWDREAAATP